MCVVWWCADKHSLGQVWSCTPVIPILGRWRWEDQKFNVLLNYVCEFQASLSYVGPTSKTTTKDSHLDRLNNSILNHLLFYLKILGSVRDALVGKSICWQAQQHEFNPQDHVVENPFL